MAGHVRCRRQRSSLHLDPGPGPVVRHRRRVDRPGIPTAVPARRHLDSSADLLLLFAAFYGAWAFYPDIVAGHVSAGIILIGAWLVQVAAALLRYGRLSSFHTYLSKIAGYLLGIFVGAWFVFGFQPWLLYLAVGVSVLGNLEELVLLALLPAWRPDVPGLWWLLRERRAGSPS